MAKRVITVNGPFFKGDTYTSRFLQVEEGTNLLRALRENGYELRCCEGKDGCGKCRVCFLRNAPLPTFDERTFLLPSELREGWRLACRHEVQTDATIRLLGMGSDSLGVVLPENVGAALPEEFAEKDSYIAIDIGTTTIAMQAYTMDAEAKLITSYTAMNPQRQFGADVISRIAAAQDSESREKLTKLLISALESGIQNICRRLVRDPAFAVITCNTTMRYFLQGLSVDVLGHAPFGPVENSLFTCHLAGMKTYVIPGYSAFVGGDLLAGEMYLENRYTDEISLLVDLGTNGEIVLKKGKEIYATATAAGPAFEGHLSADVLGANFLGFAAKLLREQMMDMAGLLKEPYFTEGVSYGKCLITQKDIRQLQEAKAAVRAGIEIVLARAGLEPADVPYVYLAGGFGYYLSPEDAIACGLLPEEFDGHIYSIGNSSLAGGREIGRLILDAENPEPRLMKRIQGMQAQAKVLNLAEEPDFDELYITHMYFRMR